MRKAMFCALSLLVGWAGLVGGVTLPAKALASSAFVPTVGANSDVLAITADAEHIFLGGSFTYVGFSSGAGVGVDTETGLRLSTLARVTGGEVRAAVSDGKGGWYIGGSFTSVAGSPRAGLARILSTGAAATWAPRVQGSVESIAFNGTTLYVGGSFTSVAGVNRTNAAALDTAGAVLPWQPSPDGTVRAIAADVTQVYLGGSFGKAGGAARANLAAVHLTTGAATAWNPGADAPVHDLSLAAGVVYAGGEFDQVAGQPRAHLAAVSTGGALGSWNPGTDGVVSAVVAKKDGSVVYAGGQFAMAGATQRQNLAAFQGSTGAATTWNPGADGPVLDLALSRATATASAEATLHVGGTFTRAGGAVRYNLAGIDAASGTATAWDPGADTTVRAVSTSGTKIFVGGSFSWINGGPRKYVAALHRTTLELDRDWVADASAPVNALAVDPNGGALYIGGEFVTLSGQDRKHLAAVVPSTGAVTGWAPRTNNPVKAIAPTQSAVYVGGTFSNINGIARSRIGAVNTTTGATLTTFNPGASDTVRFLELSPDLTRLYVGGRFATISGVPRPGCAELTASTGSATSFAPSTGGDVVSLDLANNGDTLWCSTSSNRTYSYPLVGGPTAPTWTTQTSGDVQAAEDDGGDLYIGGHFSSIKEGNKQHQRLHAASLSTGTGLATAWNPSVAGIMGVWEIAVVGDLLLVGGDFAKVGGKTQPSFAVFSAP